MMDESYLNQLRSRLDPSYNTSPPLPLPVADGGSSASLLHHKQEMEDEEVVHSSGLESQVGSTVPLTEDTNQTGEEQPNLENEPKRRKRKRKTKKRRKEEEEEVREEMAESSMDIVDAVTQPLEGTVIYMYMNMYMYNNIIHTCVYTFTCTMNCCLGRNFVGLNRPVDRDFERGVRTHQLKTKNFSIHQYSLLRLQRSSTGELPGSLGELLSCCSCRAV